MKILAFILLFVTACAISGCGTFHAITHTPMFKVPDAPPSDTKPMDTKHALQATVNKQVGIMWGISGLLLVACGLCFWMQNYFMSLKFGMGALVLPVIATIYSLFWGLLAAAFFVAVAIIAYLHYKTVIDPWFKRKGSIFQK